MNVQSSLFTLAVARKVTRVSLFAMGVAIAAMPSVARADLVLIGATPAASFRDLGAQGFGAAPRMLTLQTNGVETGNVTPVDVVHGDVVPGANKSTTPTLSALGWTSGAEVGIGFNSDQSGQTGITMQSLTLTIFNGITPVVGGVFNLAASSTPLTFTAADLALQQGNGSAVFDFILHRLNRLRSTSSWRCPAPPASLQDWLHRSVVRRVRLQAAWCRMMAPTASWASLKRR